MSCFNLLFPKLINQLRKLDKALDICTQTEKKIKITGRPDGCTSAELADYIMDTIKTL